VLFATTWDKDQIWQARSQLKGTSIFINEDFSPDTSSYRASLVPILKAAKDQNKKCTISGDTLILEGKRYPKGKLADLPKDLSPIHLSQKSNDTAIAFFGKSSPLSNFYPAKFVIDGTQYCSNEQYYQAQKAITAKDNGALDQIMSTEDPSEHKRLGSSIKVNADLWDTKSTEIMHNGLMAKFDQNRELAEYLVKTGSRQIYEASPRDKTWGVGLSLSHPRILDESAHTGLNLLGKILMTLREQINSHIEATTMAPPVFATSPVSTIK
jgi:hypothetical protein